MRTSDETIRELERSLRAALASSDMWIAHTPTYQFWLDWSKAGSGLLADLRDLAAMERGEHK